MLQVAAALLFTLAAGLGLAVILAMLTSNGNAILSALAGDGAFPADGVPASPAPAAATTRQRPARRLPVGSVSRAIAAQPLLSRAA